jgi:hypothetical protein
MRSDNTLDRMDLHRNARADAPRRAAAESVAAVSSVVPELWRELQDVAGPRAGKSERASRR